MTPSDLRKLANRIRRRDVRAVYEAGAGHIGGELSVIDLLTCLYFAELSVDPANPLDPQRDRLVLSKGHTALALYVVLAEKGFIPEADVATFLKHRSKLNGHPNRVYVPGVETNTGPLGHGLPVGVGMAKAAQLDGASWRTFVITGDGEMQEGSNWEAIMAAAQFGLDNLTLIVDHNKLQQGATLAETNGLAPLAPKIAAFGWYVEEIDGHDHAEICRAISRETGTAGRPKCIVAHTNKGHGVSFMSGNVAWHHKVPDAEQYEQAMTELAEAAE